jgi:hypothetical protein
MRRANPFGFYTNRIPMLQIMSIVGRNNAKGVETMVALLEW